MFKTERRKTYIGLGICVILFVLGQLLLNISEQENPLFGTTFHIVMGSVLRIVSVIAAVLLVRHLIQLKRKAKKKKNKNIVFLDHPKSRKKRNSH